MIFIHYETSLNKTIFFFSCSSASIRRHSTESLAMCLFCISLMSLITVFLARIRFLPLGLTRTAESTTAMSTTFVLVVGCCNLRHCKCGCRSYLVSLIEKILCDDRRPRYHVVHLASEMAPVAKVGALKPQLTLATNLRKLHDKFMKNLWSQASCTGAMNHAMRSTKPTCALSSSGGRFGRRGDGTRPVAAKERPPSGDHHPQVQDPGHELCEEFPGNLIPCPKFTIFKHFLFGGNQLQISWFQKVRPVSIERCAEAEQAFLLVF